MKATAHLTRYFDSIYETDLHDALKSWFRKKEMKWSVPTSEDTYSLSHKLKLEIVVQASRNLPSLEKNFSAFVLVSRLGTQESIKAFTPIISFAKMESWSFKKCMNDGVGVE